MPLWNSTLVVSMVTLKPGFQWTCILNKVGTRNCHGENQFLGTKIHRFLWKPCLLWLPWKPLHLFQSMRSSTPILTVHVLDVAISLLEESSKL